MEHLEALPTGGVTLGNRALADLPGVDGMGPFKREWIGLYVSSHRRILVNTGARNVSISAVLHEFGHAADHAYGVGTNWLSKTAEWAAVRSGSQRSTPQMDAQKALR